MITEQLAKNHSHLLAGIHLTDVFFTHTFQKPDDLSAAEQEYFAAIQQFQKAQGAYNMIQSTRPQTLAAGLHDSPVALASWLVDKFHAWNDSDGLYKRGAAHQYYDLLGDGQHQLLLSALL